MGAGQSSGIEIEGSSMGYQVLRVYPDSPGSKAGLKAYFDFIISIANTRFNKENGALREILKASVDQKLKMVVFNTRTKRTRETEIIPSTSWGGNGLLGVSIKHTSFDKADERVWHVVEVEPGSPAQQAGFRAGEDYVIGSDSILQESDDLYNLIETHEGKALKLFVYNVNNDNCREVICHPNSTWGGKGYLGCEFGIGLLHRIPYGDDSDGGDAVNNSRASLLRNEQPMATSQLNTTIQQQTSANTNMYNNMQSQTSAMNQPQQQQRLSVQPGQQLLQQALFDQKPKQQQQQPQQTPLATLSTFAQLANANFPAEQKQPVPQQNPNQSANQHQQQQPSPPQFQMPPYQTSILNQSNPQQLQFQQLNQQQHLQQGPPPSPPPSQQQQPLQPQIQTQSQQQQQIPQQTPSPPVQNFNLLTNSQYQTEKYQQPTTQQQQPSPQQQPTQYHMPPYQSSIQTHNPYHPQHLQQSQQQPLPQQTPLPHPQTFAQLASTQYQTEYYQSGPPPPPPPQQQQQQQQQQLQNSCQSPSYQLDQSNVQEKQQQHNPFQSFFT